MDQGYVITGIDTNAGKTVVSAIIAEKLKASYWKPIQAGDLDNSDSITVSSLTTNVNVLEEGFRLTKPMSPHAAAAIDQVEITLTDLPLPDVDGNLIIEGAGGIMVPFNQDGDTFLDLMKWWGLPIILVSRHYLGSINHTLLSVEVLKEAGLKLEGIVFIGEENADTESIILKKTGVRKIARIPITEKLDRDFVLAQSKEIEL